MNDMINSHEAIRMVEDAVTAQMRGGYGNTSLLLAYEEVIRLAKIGEHAERIKELPTAQSNLQPTCNQLATDCISRQAAIEAIKKIPIYVTLDFGETCGKMPVVSPEAILYAIQNLPSAQPERQIELVGTESNIEILSELRAQFNCFDEVEEPCYRALSDAICALSAQPEITRCKDCRFYKTENMRCYLLNALIGEHEYCSYAERRTDETD